MKRAPKLAGVTVVAFFAGVLVLVAVDEVLSGWLKIDLPGGLVADLCFATVVYFGAAAACFWLLCGRRTGWALAGSGAVTAFFIVGLPVLMTLLEGKHDVAPPGPLPSKLDVAIITTGTAQRDVPALAPRPAPPLWNVHYSVGRARARGVGVGWQLLGDPSAQAALTALGEDPGDVPGLPRLREGGDAILLLDPDSAPPVTPVPELVRPRDAVTGEVGRWRAIVESAHLRPMPTFALLRTEDEERLASWRAWLSETGGDAVSLQQLGQRSVTDAAIQLGADAPSSDADLALAYKHRPLLFFDAGERHPESLDVDALFAIGRVHLCDDGGACSLLTRASDLRNGRTHLRVDMTTAPAATLPGPEPPSVIYVHVTHADTPGLVHLDYWWYLPYNDNPVAEHSFCGPGLQIAGLTCHQHVSDWEGITVVVDTKREVPVPTKVRYGQHDKVVEYDWPALRSLWRTPNYARFAEGVDDAKQRPIVLVARGSHASYPRLCGGGCQQPATGLPEGPHNGARAWSMNTDGACALVCVRVTPVRARGTAAALWNAFEGPWGERHCLLVVWCDVAGAPTAPAAQDRYRHPEQFDRRGPLPSST
jgi:hypothetical protein